MLQDLKDFEKKDLCCTVCWCKYIKVLQKRFDEAPRHKDNLRYEISGGRGSWKFLKNLTRGKGDSNEIGVGNFDKWLQTFRKENNLLFVMVTALML